MSVLAASVDVVGSPVPRLHTPPLRALTPETSHGFELVEFARKIGQPLLPWQETAAIAALELNPDRRKPGDAVYRFRTVVILVGRQSGKTTLLKTWALWRMVRDAHAVVVGTAQQLRTAHESWSGVVDYAERNGLATERGAVRKSNGEQTLTLSNGSRYLISAASRSAGRGFSVDLLIMDELREQRTEDAWAALTPTILARELGQVVCISNAGDDESVVLNKQRALALSGTERTVGLLEWSAPDGCDLQDQDAWAMAVPGLGHVISAENLRAAINGCSPTYARTEYLCQYVSALNPAIDPAGWQAGSDPTGSLGPLRGSLSAGIDVSLDGNHVALVAAATAADGRVRVEPIASWDSTMEARRELPEILAKLAPVELAWFPGGPAASLAPVLSALPYQRAITGADLAVACMGFADLARAGLVLHNAGALLDGQVARASKLDRGDGFVFTRKGQGNCNALYAAAGAVLSARTAKPKRKAVFVV